MNTESVTPTNNPIHCMRPPQSLELEPWPLATSAQQRILAWPRYDADDDLHELVAIIAGVVNPDEPICLCLRHDPDLDVALEQAVARIERILAPLCAGPGQLEVMVIDEPMTPDDWARLGRSVSCAVRLGARFAPTSPRSQFITALDVPVATTMLELVARVMTPRSRTGLQQGKRQRLPTVQESPAGSRHAIMMRWLDKGYRDCVPYFPPVRFDISLTEACNIRCGYCWQKKKTKGRLTFEHVAGIVDTIAAVWPPTMTFTGGEATIWPDFLRTVEHCRAAGVTQMKLITNGMKFADPAYAERVLAAGISSINLSVDTFNPERFERLRTFPFATFKQGLDNLMSLRRQYPDVLITLASVLHKEVTPEECREVKTYARDHGLSYFMQKFNNTQYPEINRQYALEAGQLRDFQAKVDWLEGSVSTAVRRQDNPLTEQRILDCYKGVSTIKLHHEGNISFCWMSAAIGNIFEESFIDIWTGERARTMRQYIRDRRCTNCDFDCDIFESLELPTAAAAVHAQG